MADEKLTVEDIKRRVAKIDAEKDDDETAHGSEDQLWEDVLKAIADGAEDPAALAREALKTRDIEFSRWRA
jgi:hypothetical protein